jgi:hypothetical protein
MPEPLISTCLKVAGYSAALGLSRPTSAVSVEAESIRQHATTVVEQVHRSLALFGSKAALISDLSALGDECGESNWDGYGAQQVNRVALKRAQDLIASLPDGVSLPEIAIEPDGRVSLDWMPANHRMLTMSVGSSDRLPYAWVDGTDRGHAVARLANGELPPRIIDEIRRFSRHEALVRAA